VVFRVVGKYCSFK